MVESDIEDEETSIKEVVFNAEKKKWLDKKMKNKCQIQRAIGLKCYLWIWDLDWLNYKGYDIRIEKTKQL